MKRWVSMFAVMVGCVSLVWAAKTTGVNTSHGNTNWNEAVWTNGFPEAGDVVIISGSARVVLTNSTPLLARFVVTNSAALILSGWDTALNAEEVIVHATITHTNNSDTVGTPGVYEDWTPDARILIVCSNLIVLPAGRINANDMGYSGGVPGSPYTNGCGPGGGFGSASACSGAGYGSEGMGAIGTFGRVYGSVMAPEDPGSGGGARPWYPATPGAPGGGAIRIIATGSVRIDGRVTADATIFYGGGRHAGAGSGGSIFITCRTFHGTGTVSAVAVDYEQAGSAGAGGGRIAVHYDKEAQAAVWPQPTVQFSARPSRPVRTMRGSGTLWLSDHRFFPYPELTGGYEFHIPGLTNWAPDRLLVNNAKILWASNCVLSKVTNVLALSGSEAMLVISNDLTAGHLYVTNRARLYIYSDPTNSPGPDYGRLISVQGTLLVGSNSFLYPHSDPTNGGSILFRVGDLTVESNGWIFAFARGFEGGYSTSYPGFGPGGGKLIGDGQSGGPNL